MRCGKVLALKDIILTEIDVGERGKIDQVLRRTQRRYAVEKAASVEIDQLLDFFARAYRDQFNAGAYRDKDTIAERWKWANLNNPNIADGCDTAWICRDKDSGRIVGHFGTTPVSLKVGSECLPAVWGRDLIILSEFRKLGIGPLLIDAVLKSTKPGSKLFLIAGLNEAVFSIYQKLGFIDLGFIPLYVRINRLDNILQSRIKNRMLAKAIDVCGRGLLKTFYTFSRLKGFKAASSQKQILISQITKFDNSFDRLWERCGSSFSIISRRDSVSLNWRFIQQPYWNYSIFKAVDRQTKETTGYVVLRESKNRGLRMGVISDLFARPDDKGTIFSLINFAVSHFEKKAGIDLIRCDILHQRISRVLKKFGFLRIRSRSHFMLTNIDQQLNRQLIVNRNNWFINYADSDLDLAV
ncbi:MAG: GNAT family N-acetyltransferase [Candidatus Omnitrophica bacterium]|nr:GNAT family N-acetyltransferase [Candidatus Omnitrophota bacterium]